MTIEILHKILIDRGLSVATAESCTGGLLAARLTDLAGSSKYFLGSIVSYSNQVKSSHLQVTEACLRDYGAVSEQSAQAMLLGLHDCIPSDIGVSITGIAGPDGGSASKPVGTVWMGFRVGAKCSTERFQFVGDRHAVRTQSVAAALEGILFRLRQE